MENELKRAEDGMLICPNCSKPMDCITRAYYEHLEWDDELKKYRKTEWPGDVQAPMCGECGEYLDSKYATLFDEEINNELSKLRGVISKAINEIETHNREDESLPAKIWDILRSAERGWRE